MTATRGETRHNKKSYFFGVNATWARPSLRKWPKCRSFNRVTISSTAIVTVFDIPLPVAVNTVLAFIRDHITVPIRSFRIAHTFGPKDRNDLIRLRRCKGLISHDFLRASNQVRSSDPGNSADSKERLGTRLYPEAASLRELLDPPPSGQGSYAMWRPYRTVIVARLRPRDANRIAGSCFRSCNVENPGAGHRLI